MIRLFVRPGRLSLLFATLFLHRVAYGVDWVPSEGWISPEDWISPEAAPEVPEIKTNIQKSNPCDRSKDSYEYEKDWYDETQVLINSSLCEPALWFDDFFADERLFAEGRPGTYGRWRHEFIYDEEDKFVYTTSLDISAELPSVTKRLRLTFESDDEEGITDVIPGDEANIRNTLGLQFDFLKNIRSIFKISLNLKPRIRARYRYNYPLPDNYHMRYTLQLQNEKAVKSTFNRIDIEKFLYEKYLLRATTELRTSDNFVGVDWAQAVVLFQRINPQSSFSYESGVTGITRPETRAINYRLGVRYRRNFHRKWLFFEVSPDLTWPVTYDDARQNVLIERRKKWQVLFRLEIHFGNATKKQYEQFK